MSDDEKVRRAQSLLDAYNRNRTSGNANDPNAPSLAPASDTGPSMVDRLKQMFGSSPAQSAPAGGGVVDFSKLPK
jgi:hypothetical protein